MRCHCLERECLQDALNFAFFCRKKVLVMVVMMVILSTFAEQNSIGVDAFLSYSALPEVLGPADPGVEVYNLILPGDSWQCLV